MCVNYEWCGLSVCVLIKSGVSCQCECKIRVVWPVSMCVTKEWCVYKEWCGVSVCVLIKSSVCI